MLLTVWLKEEKSEHACSRTLAGSKVIIDHISMYWQGGIKYHINIPMVSFNTGNLKSKF